MLFLIYGHKLPLPIFTSRNYPYALEAARGLLLLGVKKVNLASLLLKSTINDEDW